MNRVCLFLLTTVSGVALSTVASAADLPARAPTYKAPVTAIAAWSWAGSYIGINAGVAWNRAEFEALGDSSNPPEAEYFSIGSAFWTPNKAGFTIGGQLGHNWQSGNIVYGLEADLNWVDGKTSALLRNSSVAASTKLDLFATVRGRLGVALSSSLVYVIGGLAVGHFKDAWDATGATPPGYSSNTTRVGWTVGGGIEHMLTRNWTAKIEGLYADFGHWNTNGPAGIVGPYRSQFTHSVAMVRGGLNWKW